ncbi:hypothetical protein J2S72_001566 [Peptoniphilus koenoeneniae]|uniref:Uncharacterized protein n=1 Tax=Peptoniphilus koenoeneniae TaxID=507751 RepID=A0ABU0AW91_9FIRM|nr:hypothetical protein HMPREF1253_0646 [Peptoniphilus sp. BV3C26]MDQ0275537.1 hypothetical protein [Peptoniphilus koenoeneniae]
MNKFEKEPPLKGQKKETYLKQFTLLGKNIKRTIIKGGC